MNLLFDCIKLQTKQRRLVEDARISDFEIDGYKSLVECGDNVGRLAILQRQFDARCKKLLEECADGATVWQRHRLATLVEITKGKIDGLQALTAGEGKAEEQPRRG